MSERQHGGDGASTDGRGGRLTGLAAVFLRLGLTSFGGPAAHVALMRDEFVRRRGWLDDPTFLDLLGAANLIPGPTSTELAMHIGFRRAGRSGLVVAGLAFLLPAVLVVAALAWLYVEYGRRPEIEALFVGVAPVVVAVIVQAGWSIARGALRAPWHAGLLAAAVAAILAGLPEIGVLLLAGVVGLVVGGGLQPSGVSSVALWLLPAPTAVVAATVSAAAILLAFLKIGAVLFGSGYVLVALLRSELVDGLGWLTETQLLDAVAVGQATPGPLFSTATFIGYVIGGPVGSIAATVGVFLPAFIAVGVSIPILHRLRGSARARAFLDGVNVAAVGLIAVVAVQLAATAIRDVVALGEAVVALVLLTAGLGSGRLVLAGAAIGLIRLALDPR
ncbi:MAG TPA: chromate efflux transporter [Candidatus Limnocylindrales bacterium]|nr:chromate efflux transporter [Candidatus Limnocylindrales bacterium]